MLVFFCSSFAANDELAVLHMWQSNGRMGVQGVAQMWRTNAN